MRVLTTVVGSMPRKLMPIEEAIKWAVDLQLSYGIDMISDGEQRSDMTGYFQGLPGLEKTRYGPCISSKVKPFEDVQNFTKVRDYEFVRRYLSYLGKEDKVLVKTAVTGPITLGFSCAAMGIKSSYNDIRDVRIYEDFAEALRPVVERLLSMGSMVQIDEPSLSTRVMEETKAIKIINNILLNGLDMDDRLSFHICGAIKPELFNNLLKIDAPIISLAFGGAEEGKNVEILSRKLLEESSTKLGAGCISVAAMKEQDVESIETVCERLNKIKVDIGLENIAYLHPNCGFGSTKEDLVFKILETMQKSVDHWHSN